MQIRTHALKLAVSCTIFCVIALHAWSVPTRAQDSARAHTRRVITAMRDDLKQLQKECERKQEQARHSPEVARTPRLREPYLRHARDCKLNLDRLLGQLRLVEELYLAPSPEDLQSYGDYTRNSAGGVIRLLSPDDYPELTLDYRRKAAVSFVSAVDQQPHPFDLIRREEYFQARTGSEAFGLIRDLGDVPLDEVGSGSAAVDPLLLFVPPPTRSGMEREKVSNQEKLANSEPVYLNAASVRMKHTYVLRTVNYGESDVAVAFRVVREDDDHSLILIWKLLKRNWIPKLVEDQPVPRPSPSSSTASATRAD